MFDVLQGRASLKNLTAAGPDGCLPEVYKALPFTLVRTVWRLFQHRYADHRSVDPPEWKVLEYIG